MQLLYDAVAKIAAKSFSLAAGSCLERAFKRTKKTRFVRKSDPYIDGI
jgi:hypothetical protein